MLNKIMYFLILPVALNLLDHFFLLVTMFLDARN